MPCCRSMAAEGFPPPISLGAVTPRILVSERIGAVWIGFPLVTLSLPLGDRFIRIEGLND